MMHTAFETPTSTTSPAKESARAVAAKWTTGGTSVHSKDSVLVFRLAALKNTGQPNRPGTAVAPVDSRPVIVTAPAPAAPVKVLEPSNRIKQFAVNALNKKRAHASLSSSDNSISSACDELADADEADTKSPLNADPQSPNATTSATAPVSTNLKTGGLPGHSPSGASSASSASSVAVHTVACHSTGGTKKDGKENDAGGRPSPADSPPPVNIAEMPGRTMHINYRFQNCETRLLRRILNSHGLTEVDEGKSFSLLWTGIHVKTDVLRALLPHQRVNHFPRSSELTRKDRLYKNIEKMQHLRGFKAFDIVPQSFMLPMEYRNLVTAHRSTGQKMPWIVKPAASSRGRGIFLVHSPEQIAMDEQVLVSRYIANPLCIDGHKCDIRLYVVVTSFDPLVIYLYDEGLVRLATVKYDKSVENLWNPCMHLCNYSINKYHSDYIKASDQCEDVGHKWSFSALLRHLRTQGCDTRELMLGIEDLIVKSIFASAQSIAAACRMFVPHTANCFELYGYDILIDDTLKPWLLEVNMSPSLGIDTPLDTKVKASMIADLLTMVGIPSFDPTGPTPAINRRTTAAGSAGVSAGSAAAVAAAAAATAATESKWSRYRQTAGISKCRRSASTESTPGAASVSSRRSTPSTAATLTSEERRIVNQTRAQFERRGGFVRIFPAPDSMQKYGHLMDAVTGIPMSTASVNGINTFSSMILPHNYNQMLFAQLHPGRPSTARHLQAVVERLANDRMVQYERTLPADSALLLKRCGGADVSASVSLSALSASSATSMRSLNGTEDVKQLHRQLRRLIESGAELSQLQARRLFQRYLETVLDRLASEPSRCSQQEKSVLKFLTRSDVASIKTPSFIKNPNYPQQRVLCKDRSALVAKLLGDYVELYHKESEAYVDDCDRPGIVPRRQFDEFMALAQESDIESVLTLHTNVTQSLIFLSTRCTLGAQVPPPIPTGPGGFLRALPAMVAGPVTSRDVASIDTYYRQLQTAGSGEPMPAEPTVDASVAVVHKTTTTNVVAANKRTLNAATLNKKRDSKIMSTSTTVLVGSGKSATGLQQQQPIKKRSVSQSALHRKLLQLWSRRIL